MYYSWWDPTYFLVIIGAVICLIASARQYVRHDRRTGGAAYFKQRRDL